MCSVQKWWIILFLPVVCVAPASGQKIEYKGNIVHVDDRPCLVLKPLNKISKGFSIESMSERALLSMCNTSLNGQDLYIIKFASDNKTCAVRNNGGGSAFYRNIVSALIKANVFQGDTVNVAAKNKFIADHPVPDGFADPDEYRSY